MILEKIQGNSMEIKVSVDVKESQSFTINVLCSPDKEECTRITFFKNKGILDYDRYEGWEYKKWIDTKYSLISIDNSRSSILPDVMSNPPETGPFHLPKGQALELRIFIDKSVVKVIANNRQCTVYPGLQESTGVSVRSQGRESKIIALDAWQMTNIYE